MFRFIGVYLVLVTLLGAPQAFASEENWFEVEVYVFSRQSNDTEQWPVDAAPADTRKAIDLITPVIATDVAGLNSALNGCDAADWATRSDWCSKQLQSKTKAHPDVIPPAVGAAKPTYAKPGEGAVLLASNQGQFDKIIGKISREPGVTSLLHMTWQENMLPRRQARPIRIFAGKNFGKQYQEDGQLVEEHDDLMQHFSNLTDFMGPQGEQPVWQLDGTINIYLNHWLYIETDLVLREEGDKARLKGTLEDDMAGNQTQDAHNQGAEQAQADIPPPFLYAIHMKQNRRVRSGEMHYFDHPKLGLVIQIRKMKKPDQHQTRAQLLHPAPQGTQ
ncbi:MAG: peptidoglycan binding protein CsiV [Shewanella sp.]|nr:peptidoglycan binding protein CsiV [Shewanella sp.]MCF1429985.1 peptidoglycan binding protein CsiV [Shewanella sp.]MCF1438986.1 peptidoglycan binding protein CsiV [Shewanella sp.]MCF1457771.1 peptidoglycan binding protein CsiV [Shewanella sp.]